MDQAMFGNRTNLVTVDEGWRIRCQGENDTGGEQVVVSIPHQFWHANDARA